MDIECMKAEYNCGNDSFTDMKNEISIDLSPKYSSIPVPVFPNKNPHSKINHDQIVSDENINDKLNNSNDRVSVNVDGEKTILNTDITTNSGTNLPVSQKDTGENYLLSIKNRCKKKIGRRDRDLVTHSTPIKNVDSNSATSKITKHTESNLNTSSSSIIESIDQDSILKDYLAFLYGDEASSLEHNEYDTSFLKIEESSSTSSSSNSEVPSRLSARHKSIENKFEYRRDGGEGKPFICGICSKSFGQHSNIVLHMRSHTGEKPYICDVCSKGFSGKSDLNRHKNIHSVIKKYWCDECKRGFNDNSGFRRHKLIYHSASSQKCTICPKSYLAVKDLERHMKTHNKPEKMPNTPQERTDQPQESTDQNSSYNSDNMNMEETNLDGSSAESDKSPNLSLVNSSPQGEIASNDRSSTSTRNYQFMEERPHKCGQCNFSCSKRSNLRKHIAYVHCLERFYKCDICFKGFKSSWALKRHKQVHSEEKIYQCDLCDKGFNDTGSFKYHMKSHRGEKSHQCEICAKSFILKSDLKKHMSSHIKRLQQAAEEEAGEDMEVLIQSDDSFLDLASYV